MTFFRTDKISDRITCITDVAGTHFFLVEGDRCAALIDTGCSCGDLGDLITTLTALPVQCILTHGHVDHAMGDACNGFTFLFDQCASSVSDYRAMLLQLKETVACRYDTVLVCHGPVPFAPADRINRTHNLSPAEKSAGLRLSKYLFGRSRRARRPSDCIRIAWLCRAGGTVSASAETIPYIFCGRQL